MPETTAYLIADVARLLRRRFDERARTIGATRAQWRALATLSRNEGANQGMLAELLEVEPITLCRMVDRLEEAGLVERRRDPADRRVWRIFLTDASRPVLADLRDMADDLFAQAFAGMGDAERGQITVLLDRVRSNLHALPPVKDAAHG